MAEYIEREALLHDIEQSVVYTVREKITSAEMRGARKVIERIKCAPAVEPIYIHEPTKSEFKRMAAQMGYEPIVHGRWIGAPLCGNDNCRCSECGSWHNIHANLLGEIMQKYCPYCGAKMDGSDSDAAD